MDVSYIKSPTLPVTDDATSPPGNARHGWSGTFQNLIETEAVVPLAALQRFLPDAGASQVTAWRDSIRLLRTVGTEVLTATPAAAQWGGVLEYEMPMELRRADAVLLAGGVLVVLEFKGKAAVTAADINQARAYARDLRCYHDGCHDRSRHPVLVPTWASRLVTMTRGVLIRGPLVLPELLASLCDGSVAGDARRLPHVRAYRTLPTLVVAARELFQIGILRLLAP